MACGAVRHNSVPLRCVRERAVGIGLCVCVRVSISYLFIYSFLFLSNHHRLRHSKVIYKKGFYERLNSFISKTVPVSINKTRHQLPIAPELKNFPLDWVKSVISKAPRT